MKKLAISIAAIAAFIATSASAADMAVKAPPAAAPKPTDTWTGFYIGGNAGYGWQDPTVTATANDLTAQLSTCGGSGGATCIPPASFNIGGASGGLQAGYNWQVNQNWLVGVETDFDWSNITGSGTSSFLFPTGVPSTFQASENVKWFGTVRGRAGLLPRNNLLIYGTGGFAYGRVDTRASINASISGVALGFPNSFNCTGAGGPGAINCFVGNSSRIGAGFSVGGGAEYRLWNNISLKAEYLYVNLGRGNTVDVIGTPVPGLGTTASSFTAAYSRTDFNVIRVGLNWKL